MIKKFTNNCKVEEEELKLTRFKVKEKNFENCDEEDFKETSTQPTDLIKVDNCLKIEEEEDQDNCLFGEDFGYESDEYNKSDKDEIEHVIALDDVDANYFLELIRKNNLPVENLEEIEVTDPKKFADSFVFHYKFDPQFLIKNVDCMKIRLNNDQIEDLVKFTRICSVNKLDYNDKDIKVRRQYYYVLIAQYLLLYQQIVYQMMGADVKTYDLKVAMQEVLKYRDDTELTDLFHSLIKIYRITKDKNYFKFCWCILDMFEYVSKL